MKYVEVDEFLERASTIPIVDVRSPAEYNKGHIPLAISIPLFTDEERMEVGTLYKQKGRLEAIKAGLAIAGPKLHNFSVDAIKLAYQGELLLYCWRGGMRSEKMAWLFETVGLECRVLQGGYKAYRKSVMEIFEKIEKLIVLHGPTGTGKTEILHELAKNGEQIIDLEGMANHKGSAFGGLGMKDQPSSSQFHNMLYDLLRKFNLNHRIWIESESMTVGKVYLPETLWDKMNSAELIEISLPTELRLQRIINEYGQFTSEELVTATKKISQRLGGEKTKLAIELVTKGNLKEAVTIFLEYYDNNYQYSRNKYKQIKSLKYPAKSIDANINALHILNIAKEKIEMPEKIRLTEYSHGAGCGCKISPKVLEGILHSKLEQESFPNLLIGNSTRDDAAVYAIDDERAIISTTDFFMPIVDDPFDFGGIASVNAISDIYAMGGTPLMAIAILGWPLDKLSAKVAQQVLEGARSACHRAGIPLAGGHSIDAPEPIFGLAVTGSALKNQLRSNSSAIAGCELYLSKPIGVGILSTAQKRGVIQHEDLMRAKKQMLSLNNIGMDYANLKGVKSMTDVTGFGLLGHLLEMCEGSGLHAEIDFDKVPKLPHLIYYFDKKTFPGGTERNFESYGGKVSTMNDLQKAILCDPQTSGGLLVALDPEDGEAFHEINAKHKLRLTSIGRLMEPNGNNANIIRVN